jgi:hypothetical protein
MFKHLITTSPLPLLWGFGALRHRVGGEGAVQQALCSRLCAGGETPLTPTPLPQGGEGLCLYLLALERSHA